MSASYDNRLERRVAQAAEQALAARKFVTPIDVLTGLGWLHEVHVDVWRQQRVETLDQLVQVGPERVELAMELLRRWAMARRLEPSEAEYLARSRIRRPLRFSADGDAAAERTFRTRWLSPDFTERERAKLTERENRARELVAIWPLKDFTCSTCGSDSGGFLIMDGPGPVCMSCADMDHLVFLPSGDAALTRRARAGSRLSAVVVRFSRSRRRYERQGALVEEGALERAEAECLADEKVRARRRERDAARRAARDRDLEARFTDEIRRLFPGCPARRAERIAGHATVRSSGRVGRSAAGRALDANAVELAVAASVRHEDTGYDDLLMSGFDREDARGQVGDAVTRVLAGWRDPAPIVDHG